MPRSSRALRRFNYLLSETDAAYHEAASRLGLSDSVMQILYTVCDSDSGERCPLSEVCRRTGISKQTINSALRRLEADGIVRLEQAGGRSKDVCLTRRGGELAQDPAPIPRPAGSGTHPCCVPPPAPAGQSHPPPAGAERN